MHFARGGVFLLDLPFNGRPDSKIGPYDLLIAGLAKSRDWILVTNNTGEFERIAGLHVENWAYSNENK